MENKKEIDNIQLLADIKAVVEKHGAKISEYTAPFCQDKKIIFLRCI